MSKPKYNSDQLFEEIEVVSTITCSNCRTHDIYPGDEFLTAEQFFKKGWRATISRNVYCPKCSKIKLKQTLNLSDIKFDKNKPISKAKLEKSVKTLNKQIQEIEDRRKISDYSKLNRPMDI